MINRAPSGKVVLVYLLVMTVRLFLGICRAFVFYSCCVHGGVVQAVKEDYTLPEKPYLDVCVRESLTVEEIFCCNPDGVR